MPGMTQAEVWTIGRLLNWTTDFLRRHGSETPRLDAEVLLAHAHGWERIQLYTHYGDIPNEDVRSRFREMIRRRAEGVPVAYLVGEREFFSLKFHVTPDVLIPRPETEFVIVTLLERVRGQDPRNPGGFAMLARVREFLPFVLPNTCRVVRLWPSTGVLRHWLLLVKTRCVIRWRTGFNGWRVIFLERFRWI
jgi:hypothetical protein